MRKIFLYIVLIASLAACSDVTFDMTSWDGPFKVNNVAYTCWEGESSTSLYSINFLAGVEECQISIGPKGGAIGSTFCSGVPVLWDGNFFELSGEYAELSGCIENGKLYLETSEGEIIECKEIGNRVINGYWYFTDYSQELKVLTIYGPDNCSILDKYGDMFGCTSSINAKGIISSFEVTDTHRYGGIYTVKKLKNNEMTICHKEGSEEKIYTLRRELAFPY